MQGEKRKGRLSKDWVRGYLCDYKAFQLVRKESQLLSQRSVASKGVNDGRKPNLRESRELMEITDFFYRIIQYLELEGTHRDQWVQLLGP